MDQATELLNSIAEGEGTTYAAGPTAEEHIVIGKDRFIHVPESIRKIGVQFDHNVETVTFDCPRTWDGVDMSTKPVYINYMRPDGEPGSYLVETVTPDVTNPDIMHFDWKISKHVTEVNGQLSILVCVIEIDEESGDETFHWNSELNNEMELSKGMPCQQHIVAKYPDIITQLLSRMSKCELDNDSVLADARAVLDEAQGAVQEVRDIAEGVTVPKVAGNGHHDPSATTSLDCAFVVGAGAIQGEDENGNTIYDERNAMEVKNGGDVHFPYNVFVGNEGIDVLEKASFESDGRMSKEDFICLSRMSAFGTKYVTITLHDERCGNITIQFALNSFYSGNRCGECGQPYSDIDMLALELPNNFPIPVIINGYIAGSIKGNYSWEEGPTLEVSFATPDGLRVGDYAFDIRDYTSYGWTLTNSYPGTVSVSRVNHFGYYGPNHAFDH